MSKIWLIVHVAIGVILSLSWHEQTIVIANSTGAPVFPAGSAGIGSSHPGNGGPPVADSIIVNKEKTQKRSRSSQLFQHLSSTVEGIERILPEYIAYMSMVTAVPTPAAEPTSPPVPEPTDPPVSKPTDPPFVDEETDAPVPEPTDPPQEETDSPTSFFLETPQPTVAPTTEPTSELSFIVSIEYPTDATRKPRAPPVDEPVKKPRAPPVDEPVKKPRAPPVEEPVEKPVKKPRNAPIEEPYEDKPVPAPRKKPVHAAPILHMFDKPSRKPTRRPTRDPTVSPEPSISSIPTRAPPNLNDLLASMMENVEKIQNSDDESDNMKEFASITSQILDRYVVYNYTIDDEDL